MRENTKRFFHNSAISVSGFVLTNAVTLLAVGGTKSVFGGQLAAGTALLFLCGGLGFVGYAVIRLLEKKWQTALSLTVVPILTILSAVCMASVIIRNPYPLLLLSFSTELYFALIPEAVYSGNDAVICILAPFIPLLCISIGAAVRSRLEKEKV